MPTNGKKYKNMSPSEQRTARAKRRVQILIDQGVPYNPAGMSDFAREHGANRASQNMRIPELGRGASSSGIAAKIRVGDAGTAVTPRRGAPGFKPVKKNSGSYR